MWFLKATLADSALTEMVLNRQNMLLFVIPAQAGIQADIMPATKVMRIAFMQQGAFHAPIRGA